MPVSLRNLGAAAILAVGTAFAGAASAATIVQSQFFSFGEANASVTVASGATDSATNQQALSFGGISRFNTGLGALNSVSFNVSWTGEVEYSWQKLASFTDHSVTYLSTVSFRADGIADSVSNTAGSTQTVPGGPFPLDAFGAFDIAGGGTFSETNAAFLALFSGPGSIASSIELENFVELTVTSGGSVTAAARGCPAFGSIICGVISGNPLPLVGGVLEITYDYTEATVAVSAPGGIAMLSLGLAGFGFARWKRMI